MALTKVMHKGKEIVIADFANKRGPELIEYMTQFSKDLVATGKKNLILMDQTNVVMTREISQIQKEHAVKLKDYQGKLALLGITGMQSIIAKAIMAIVSHDVKMFDTKEEAMDWLAGK